MGTAEQSNVKSMTVSDDGDPFEVGDYVVNGQSYSGANLCIIRGIIGDTAIIDPLDVDMQPTGNLITARLSDLTEYNIFGEDDETDPSAKGAPGTDAPDSSFAFVPKDGPPSARKLPINDAQHVRLAVQAITKGMGGNKPKAIPPHEKGEVMDRIKAAIDKLISDPDEQKALLAKLDGKTTLAAKTMYETIDIDEPTTAIKSVGDNGFAGYAVLWGNPSVKDLTGEYFDAATDLGLDLHALPDLPKVHIPTLYHHALDSTMKTALMGTIDNATPDDIGLWVEGQYNKRHKYLATIKDMVTKGQLSFSSGSIPHHTERDKQSGYIKRWPIYEISMTPTPAEPRGTDVIPFSRRDPATKHYGNELAISSAYKALNLPTDRLGLQDDEADGAQNSASPSNAIPSVKTVISPVIKAKPKEGIKMEMTQEQLTALVTNAIKASKDADVAAADAAVKVEAERQAAIKADVDRLVAEKMDDIQKSVALKGLPLPGAQKPGDKPAGGTAQITVGGDRRYADLSSEDLAFMTTIYGAYANKGMQRRSMQPWGATSDMTNAEKTAIKFFEDLRKDADHKFEREVSAKAIRENNRKQIPDSALTYLPYKTLDAVYGNDYDDAPIKALRDERDAAIKANELDNAAQAGFGAEWVPTLWNANLWRRIRISNPFAQTMQTIEMPSNPFNLTIESTDPTLYAIGEGTDLSMLVFSSGNTMTTSKVASGKQAITAFKQGVRIGFSDELVEDSIIPILPIYRYQAQRVIENGIDNTIANGDNVFTASTNINLIDGTPAAAPAAPSYTSFDGLRKYALITNTGQAYDGGGGAPTLALFRAARRKLARQYMVDLRNLIWVVAPEVHMKMLSMPEFANWQQLGVAGSNVTGLLPGGTADQVGDIAMPVGYIDGIPVYVSAEIPLTTSAGMNNVAQSGTFGTALLYHKTRWFLGYRRHIQVDVLTPAMMPLSDTYQLWATVRYGLKSFDATSSVTLYDLAV